MPIKPTLDQLRRYPRMAHWFNPILLSKLLLEVIVSGLFGQYADRRLIVAALDTVSDQEHVDRADISGEMNADSDGAIWIDFVADLGDGFDATYAVAYLLGQERLTVEGRNLPRGSAVFMGGDEVYPTANRTAYKRQMVEPYSFAFPDRAQADHPLLYAIPGNHDWYDGLVTFLAFFARKKATKIGNWRTRQRRSYFAVKLSDLCWLWAVDVALVEDMDQPQADYFFAVARAMAQGANIILCSAEPAWYKAEEESESYRTLTYAAWIAENAGKALRIPLVLSGDTHHYSRYSSKNGVQYITSGGGGAFLHGTHQLPDTIKADWLREKESTLSLKTEPDGDHAPSKDQACWPSMDESRRLLFGNFLFPIWNWDFAILMGLIYWQFCFLLTSLPRTDVAIFIFIVFCGGFGGYAGYQENWKLRSIAAAFVESIFHFASVAFISVAALKFGAVEKNEWPWFFWLIGLGIAVVPVGGVIGSFIFGMKLLVTCRWLNLNHNDAFSALRLFDYRHFLRIRILGDELTVYPVGLKRVPRRSEWRDNPDCEASKAAPYFIPASSLDLRLIERPIVIRGHGVPSTAEIKKPSELDPK